MGLAARTVDVDGRARHVLVARPPGPATAIVLSLHGTRSTAAEQAHFSAMETLAQTVGAVVAFPQAITPVGGRGFLWNDEADTSFLARLISELAAEHPGAGSRACLTGMSGGARMSCRFAWTHAEQVAMVGAVAGLRGFDGPPPSRPVPVVAFHGTADRLSPYRGGATARWRESVPEAARRWAAANGVERDRNEAQVSATLTRTNTSSGAICGMGTCSTRTFSRP